METQQPKQPMTKEEVNRRIMAISERTGKSPLEILKHLEQIVLERKDNELKSNEK
jgi:hypothetical protein